MTLPAPTILLFSYGTLQNRDVQLSAFGRELEGRPDDLPGYVRGKVPILDPAVIAELGQTHYENAEPSSSPEDMVSGTVLEITPDELTAADGYEAGAEYRRIFVTLRSGVQAWVYVRG